MPHHSAVLRTQRPGSRPSSASTGRRSDPVPGWRLRADPGVLSDGSENPSVKRHVEGQGEMGKTWITWITNDTCGTQIVELTNRITWFSPGKTLGIDLSTNFKERIEFLARTWGFKQQRWGHFHTLPHKNADRIDPSTNGKWICVGVFCHHFFQKDRPTHGNHMGIIMHMGRFVAIMKETNGSKIKWRDHEQLLHMIHMMGPFFLRWQKGQLEFRVGSKVQYLLLGKPIIEKHGHTWHWQFWPYQWTWRSKCRIEVWQSILLNCFFFFKRSYIHEWLSWTSNLVS